jgi:hypothetical protein
MQKFRVIFSTGQNLALRSNQERQRISPSRKIRQKKDRADLVAEKKNRAK